MQPDSRHTTEPRLELACFAAHGQLYGMDVREIREIVSRQEVTRLPGAPAVIEGLVDLRGSVMPVVDLGRLLGGEGTASTRGSRMAVLEVDGMALALCVERAVDVLSVRAEELREPPPLSTSGGSDLVRAVVRRPDGPPMLLLSARTLIGRLLLAADSEGTAT